MKQSGIKKYYIGFGILGLVTVAFTVFVLLQAASAKQDAETNKKGNQIATELNAYISKNKKIPENLDSAGIKDVPSTIKFTKKSSTEYEFCLNYKSEKSYSSGDITDVLFGSALRSSSYDDSLYDGSDYSSGSLYLPYTYKKGENCQTVKPYSLGNSLYNNYDDKSTYKPTSSVFNTVNDNAKDVERETDIKAMHAQIEAFYAQFGYYPAFNDLNDATWRKTNMKGLDEEALADPSGTTKTLAKTPAKNVYSYDVYSTDAGSCDNVATDCTGYELTSTRSDGTTYSKLSLN